MTDTAAPAPAARQFSLGDRYTTESGEILATGVQALARLPMDQMRADRRAGLATAAFISGYQGSPLGGYDRELQSQRALLDELRIVHRPALNEELGATAVTGSQVAQTFASHRYDGVLGIWYGKSPGVDRAGDAIRHGNFAGTARHGGVRARTGGHPAGKSTTQAARTGVALAPRGSGGRYPPHHRHFSPAHARRRVATGRAGAGRVDGARPGCRRNGPRQSGVESVS